MAIWPQVQFSGCRLLQWSGCTSAGDRLRVPSEWRGKSGCRKWHSSCFALLPDTFP